MQKSRKYVSSLLSLLVIAGFLLPNAARAAEPASARSPLTIGILDSGIDASHPQLSAYVQSGYNTYNNSGDTTDIVGHGTWVAGTVLTTFNAYKSSVAPDAQPTLIPVKITNEQGTGFTGTAATALLRAADAGIKIINLSFELHGGYPDINAAAREFVSRGGIVVAAAGNDAQYHAQPDIPHILSVGSVNAAGEPSRYTSSGPFVDLSAHGENVSTTGLNSTYTRVSGTSFAAPQVAAVAALVWAANPSLTNAQVVDIIKSTARDTWQSGFDDKTGVGIVNPTAAIAAAKALLPVASPEPEPAPTPIPVVAPVVAQTVPTPAAAPTPFAAPAPQVINDPSIPPMDPIYSHVQPQPRSIPAPQPKPVVTKKPTYVKRAKYVRRWSTASKRYVWIKTYVWIRA